MLFARVKGMCLVHRVQLLYRIRHIQTFIGSTILWLIEYLSDIITKDFLIHYSEYVTMNTVIVILFLPLEFAPSNLNALLMSLYDSDSLQMQF